MSIPVDVDYPHLNAFFSDYARNFSRPWTLLRTGAPLSVGQQLRFRLAAPGIALELDGVVEETGPDGVRLAFSYASPEERRKQEKMIRSLMIEHLGPRLAARILAR